MRWKDFVKNFKNIPASAYTGPQDITWFYKECVKELFRQRGIKSVF